MSDKTIRLETTLASPADQLFPTLTPVQIARIAAHGRVRHVQRGEVLIETGDQIVPFFVIMTGQVEVVRPSTAGETLITVYGPGGFTGEANMLSGRRSLARARVREPGELIELDRERMRSLVQTDTELGEIILRAIAARQDENPRVPPPVHAAERLP